MFQHGRCITLCLIDTDKSLGWTCLVLSALASFVVNEAGFEGEKSKSRTIIVS